jgi:hypothetical protein
VKKIPCCWSPSSRHCEDCPQCFQSKECNGKPKPVYPAGRQSNAMHYSNEIASSASQARRPRNDEDSVKCSNLMLLFAQPTTKNIGLFALLVIARIARSVFNTKNEMASRSLATGQAGNLNSKRYSNKIASSASQARRPGNDEDSVNDSNLLNTEVKRRSLSVPLK